MLSHSIKNTNELCSTLSSLLEDDLEYIKSHPNPKYQWGNHSESLVGKFSQYDELNSLPVFDKLAEHGYVIEHIVLYYIKPMVTKILYNTNVETKKLNKTSIAIPLNYKQKQDEYTGYLWYDPEHVKHYHQMKDFPELYKLHGRKLVCDSHIFETDTPLIVQHQNVWAGIFNKENPDPFVFLHISLKGNPEYEELKSIF